MGSLWVDQSKVTAENAAELLALCPFQALEYIDGQLLINAGCRMCRLCVKKGPVGVVREEADTAAAQADMGQWHGIAVYCEQADGTVHPVGLELLGKAQELAAVCGQPVYALLIGNDTAAAAKTLLDYGAEQVFVYDAPQLAEFKIDTYTNAFCDFISQVRPASILVGATNLGRTLAPRVAARQRTGLTADCTVLEMRPDGALVQIRPAFGGNIMAQIVTPRHRPQFCTVRYKIFSAPQPLTKPHGQIVRMHLAPERLNSVIQVLSREEKPREVDISEAEVIVACGRGFKNRGDLSLAEQLAGMLGGMTACTRPLVEAGWFDPKRQIGLSGRTVKAKLLLALGISGSIQFVAGMQGCDCIVAVNPDETASIFDVAHYGLVGDLYEIMPKLLEQLREVRRNGRL